MKVTMYYDSMPKFQRSTEFSSAPTHHDTPTDNHHDTDRKNHQRLVPNFCQILAAFRTKFKFWKLVLMDHFGSLFCAWSNFGEIQHDGSLFIQSMNIIRYYCFDFFFFCIQKYMSTYLQFYTQLFIFSYLINCQYYIGRS